MGTLIAVLFNEITRTYAGPADQAESEFAYLDRSARPGSEKIRLALEEWFNHYPADEQEEFASRFRSEEPYSCISATFELYLHELLRANGVYCSNTSHRIRRTRTFT